MNTDKSIYYSLKLYLLLLNAVLFHSTLPAQNDYLCQDEIKKAFDNTLNLRNTLRSNKNYVSEDSIVQYYIALYEQKCPCSFNYANIVNISAGIKFQQLNKRNEAFQLLTEKLKLCGEMNDSTKMYLNGRKAVYHLRNNELPLMKHHLDIAYEIGSKKFDPAYRDLFSARYNMAIYYNWKKDYDNALKYNALNEKSIEHTEFKDTSIRIENIEWCITFSLKKEDHQLAKYYQEKLTNLVKGTRFEQKVRNNINENMLRYYTEKGEFHHAEKYFEMIDTSAYNDFIRAIPLIKFLKYQGKSKLAEQKLVLSANHLNELNVPHHHLARINVMIEKADLQHLTKNEKSELIYKITDALHFNYVSLINQSPEEQSRNITLITNKYVELLQKINANQDIEISKYIYGRLNNLKNASGNYYTQVKRILHDSQNEELIKYFTEYKNLCSQPMEKVGIDSLNFLASKIHYLLKDSGIHWHSNTSLADIQNNLNDHDIFFDFYQSDQLSSSKNVFLFIISKNSFQFVKYDNISAILSCITERSNYRNNGLKNKQLYQYVVGPFEKHLQKNKNIYVSTDGILNDVAIEILSKAGTKSNILEDNFNIVHIENGRTLYKIKHKSDKENLRQFMVIGGINYHCSVPKNENDKIQIGNIKNQEFNVEELAGSAKEIKVIETSLLEYNLNSTVISECEAHKSAFITHLNDKKFSHIHVSTHGINRSGESTNTHNYFADNSRAQLLLARRTELEDAHISAIEILNQDMSDKELVFLSACSTGKGDYLSGYGNASVANAFKKAGAKLVVSTLWPISDDVSAEFSSHFYKAYLKSKDAQQALKFAKLQLREKYNPEKWAAFRLLN